ncbi:MAG: septum formation protein Maf [Burkholderiales bacterium]|nr:septum formation protein Maf [Phycisphaerae bacterium]
MKLVLASRSPQRVALLRDGGYVFETDPADIDEETYPADLDADAVARWLALAKARHVAQRHRNDLVLGADTVVALGTRLLGKPVDAADAREMIGSLSGSTHRVSTGIALVCVAKSIETIDHVVSTVQMRALSSDEIEAYVTTGDWRGKAGGYGIQDDDPFVTCIQGSVSNIIGLPMERTVELLRNYDLEK